VAEHLVGAGLARVVDWHAGMLASSGGMERLRAAEKSAKEKRACLYASIPTASSVAKSNGANNSQAQAFDATVIRVWTGDQISVIEKDTKKERRIQLSSTRSPKFICSLIYVPHIVLMNHFRVSDPKQAYYAQEAKEFLRKKLIGKQVKVSVDFVRPREGEFEERECATVRFGGQSV
jgi:staphylococcal nuclease domain-containing protein 1